jgi:hypothetical protein
MSPLFEGQEISPLKVEPTFRERSAVFWSWLFFKLGY